MSDERVDAIERALSLKPGDEYEGLTLVRKDVSNGHFVWWLSDGGCISLNNLIATIRPDKTSARTERDASRAEAARLLEAATMAAAALDRIARGWPEGNVQNIAYHVVKDMDAAIFGGAPNHHRVNLADRLVGLAHPNLWPKEAGPMPMRAALSPPPASQEGSEGR